MAKTFATMKTNVGNMVMDTSSAFATLIGVWINDKYLDIARRHPWSVLIDFLHTISVTAGTATYDLPNDFDQEIFCSDITNGILLNRYTEGLWFRERYGAYSAGSIARGQPVRYIIARETSHLTLDPPPIADITLAFPYKKTLTALSGASDTPVILNCEVAIENGALAEALAYNKQFAKADYYFQKYEEEVAKRIVQEKCQYNQLLNRISENYRVSGMFRLTGDTSYDTI